MQTHFKPYIPAIVAIFFFLLLTYITVIYKMKQAEKNLTPTKYLAQLKTILEQTGDPVRAEGQSSYMRGKFEYYGLKAPEWQAIGRAVFAENGVYEGEELKTFARLAFDDDYRELNYLAIQMLEKVVKQQPEDFIDFLEELITTKSWWDSVDWLSKLTGMHFQNYPFLIRPVTERWMASGNLWLQRVCLIFQLRYNDRTDFDLLCTYIMKLSHSKEFFLQKGAGWALRQYSKFNLDAVISSIDDHPELAPLTTSEGSKRLTNRGKI